MNQTRNAKIALAGGGAALLLLLEQAKRAHRAGRLDEARQLYLRVLAIDVHHADGLFLLGCEELDAGRAEVAARMFERAIAVDDRRAEFFLRQAQALRIVGRLPESVAGCDRALALDAGCAEVHFERGNAWRDLKQTCAAIASYRRALELDPRLFQSYVNLGNLLLAEGELETVAEGYRRYLVLDPQKVDAHCCLSGVLYLQGRYVAAQASLEEALKLEPTNAEARWNLALLQLVQGDLAKGLENFEARYRRFGMAEEYCCPHWQGEPLAGRSILLLDEQGLGDTIQFLRFVPKVEAAGGRVSVRVSKPLRRLAEASWPSVAWIDASEPLPDFDALCPLMSLPHVFGVSVVTISAVAETPYLRVPEEARQKASSLLWEKKKRCVGLVWAGNPAHALDRFRSIALDALRPLFAIPDLQFYSLQMGAGAAQRTETDLPLIDLSAHIGDMADTAALLEHLDLLIGVDTSVVHLAGALGRPVWMLTPAAPDWRWMTEREDSPWYPSLRLFRQKKLGDWTSVVARVATALRAYQQKF